MLSWWSFLHRNYRLGYEILFTILLNIILTLVKKDSIVPWKKHKFEFSWQVIRKLPIRHIPIFFHSVKRCNCYMVCAGEATGLSQSRRSAGLEIGCLIDTATGLLTFTSSGVEMATFYQVGHTGIYLICSCLSVICLLYKVGFVECNTFTLI